MHPFSFLTKKPEKPEKPVPSSSNCTPQTLNLFNNNDEAIFLENSSQNNLNRKNKFPWWEQSPNSTFITTCVTIIAADNNGTVAASNVLSVQ